MACPPKNKNETVAFDALPYHIKRFVVHTKAVDMLNYFLIPTANLENPDFASGGNYWVSRDDLGEAPEVAECDGGGGGTEDCCFMMAKSNIMKKESLAQPTTHS